MAAAKMMPGNISGRRRPPALAPIRRRTRLGSRPRAAGPRSNTGGGSTLSVRVSRITSKISSRTSTARRPPARGPRRSASFPLRPQECRGGRGDSVGAVARGDDAGAGFEPAAGGVKVMKRSWYHFSCNVRTYIQQSNTVNADFGTSRGRDEECRSCKSRIRGRGTGRRGAGSREERLARLEERRVNCRTVSPRSRTVSPARLRGEKKRKMIKVRNYFGSAL